MKKIKRILALILAVVLAVSLSACVVPSTYISVVGSYVKQNPEDFSSLTASLHEAIIKAVEESTDSEIAANYIFGLLGIDPKEYKQPQSSSAEDSEEIPPIPEITDVPEIPDMPKIPGTDNGLLPQESSSDQPEPPAEEEKPDDPSDRETKDSSSKENEESKEDVKEEDKPQDSEQSYNTKSQISSTYVPEYEHLETDEFESLLDAFVKAGKDNDEKKIKEYYDQLFEGLSLFYSMDSIAYLNHCLDSSNEYFNTEYSYTDELWTNMKDRFWQACHTVSQSAGAKAFEECADEFVVKKAKDYTPLTFRMKELLKKETDLENEYDRISGDFSQITYEYKGTVYTLEDLTDDDSSQLTELALYDYFGFMTVYEGLLAKMNQTVGPIFMELLDVRSELAKLYGYYSYTDYAYDVLYKRSYTAQEAEKYCNNIKEYISSDFYNSAYYNVYNYSYVDKEFTIQDVLGFLENMADRSDPLVSDALKEFEEKELYAIGSGSNQLEIGLAIMIPSIQNPFIYVYNSAGLIFLQTICHEFGHFVDLWYEMKADPHYFLTDYNLDVIEIHSNGFELICSNHYNEAVDPEDLSEALSFELSATLCAVTEGCIYDEFQRIVYSSPDITLDQINTLYNSICEDYGMPTIPGNQYMWALINHNFDEPLYYISYSISSLSALELWETSQKDEKEALKTLLNLLKEPDDEDYFTVMKKTGLTPFTDTEGMLKICRNALQACNTESTEDKL